MTLLTLDVPQLLQRAQWAREDAEVVRDSSLSLAYRSACLREEAAALRAQAAQVRRRAAQGRAVT